MKQIATGIVSRRAQMRKNIFQVIDYNDLKLAGDSLHTKLQHGFGESGQGAVIVRNIPGLWEARSQLISLSHQLANSSDAELKGLVCKDTEYERGWSSKNLHVYDIPQRNIGTFKAHLSTNDKYRFRTSQIENLPRRILRYVGDNKWPSSTEQKQFKQRFLQYHSLVKIVGIELLLRVEKYIESQQPYFRTAALSQILKRSDQHVGSFSYSYASASYEQLSSDWDDWHVDQSLLQGISSQIYVDQEGKESVYNDPDAGVHIFSQKPDDYIRIRIDDNSILFKAGESLQILSGGVIHAKPHRIIRGHFLAGKELGIECFSTVIQPNLEEKLSVPAGIKSKSFINSLAEIPGVSPLSERWEQGMQYGQFYEKSLSAKQK